MKRTISLFSAIVLLSAVALHAQDNEFLKHGPWLTFPDVGSVSVGYVTAPKCGGGLEYRVKGTETWTTLWDVSAGQLVRHRVQHTLTLDNLEPGNDYEYRLVIAIPTDKSYHDGNFPRQDKTINSPHIVYIENPAYHFQAFSAQPQTYMMSVTSDLQFNPQVKERYLTNYYEKGGLKDSKFFIVLGDGDNGLWNFENNYIRTLVDKVVKLDGTIRPSLFVRGNHEWREAEAPVWCDYFTDPKSHSTYSAFRCGDVFYITLDTGEDKPATRFTGHYTGNNVAEAQFFQQEHDWLVKIVQSPAFQTAKFRIVLSHGALYSHSETYMHNTAVKICGDLFKKQNPQNRIHLWVSAHTHYYCRTIPGSDMVYGIGENREKLFNGNDYTFPCVTLDGPGGGGVDNCILNVSVTPDKLSLAARDEAGTILDALEILPDGSVNDLNNNTLSAKQVPGNYK